MIAQLRNRMTRYDTAIWVRVAGTVMTTITGFMIRPFLVLYLFDQLGESVLLSMMIVGLQPLMGVLVGLWGGGMADRWGRRPLMLGALLLQGISMAGYMFADSVWEFAVMTVLNGLGMAVFFPAANAQVADVVPEERRAEVFALLHTALNVGAAAGPMLGLLVFTRDPGLAFGLSAAAFLIYALIVWWKVPETLPARAATPSVRQAMPKLVWREHTTIYLLTLFAVPISLLYSQVDSTLPLHLKENFHNYQTIFVWMMTINGTIVVLCQMWLSKWTEHWRTDKVMVIAYLMFALTAVGYGFAPTFLMLIAAEVVFTIGEMLAGPHMQKAVSNMAPPEMRGRYFSIYGSNWQISRAFGPVFGGFLFEQIGGSSMFVVLAILLLVAGAAQVRLIRQVLAGRTAKVSTVSTAVE